VVVSQQSLCLPVGLLENGIQKFAGIAAKLFDKKYRREILSNPPKFPKVRVVTFSKQSTSGKNYLKYSSLAPVRCCMASCSQLYCVQSL